MKKTFSILTLAVILSLIASPSSLGIQQASADSSTSPTFSDATASLQSVASPDASINVAVIGGPTIINGGTIPTPSNGGTITYTDIFGAGPLPSLAAFDTVILNVASSLVGCDLSGTGNLSVADLATLVAFMQAGGKLIIYDSECSANDFTWLPNNLRFTTSNPGAAGAAGTASIVEQNALSTTASGAITPPEIDIVALCTDGSSFFDACGDANVMIGIGSELCKDIDANNVNEAQELPTHVYSKSGGSSGLGMLIYNGFDYDEVSTIPDLQALTLYELQVDFNPHDPSLVCATPVVVGGEFMSIDTTALILAGAQTNAVWIMSALAVIGSVAFGALYISSRKN